MYNIIRSRRRSISLIINQAGELIVRAPLRVSDRYIQQLVIDKQRWITRKQQQIIARKKHHEAQQICFADGQFILFLGEKYLLRFCSGCRTKIILEDKNLILVGNDIKKLRAKLIVWYKQRATEILSDRLHHYVQTTKCKYRSMKITSARHRFGSCNSIGTISFSWRIIMAPMWVVDYVVVHELMHTCELNHARRFWEKVADVIPNYKECKQWLVDNQMAMEIS